MAEQPWYELSPEVADVLRSLLPDLVNEIIAAVGEVPAYGRPLEGRFGTALRGGVEEALRHLAAEVEASGPVPRTDVYRELGRGEMHAGRSLDSLLSAYRIGARVTWRRVAAAGEQAGLKPSTLYLLAEAIFAYIDVLSAESAEGYAMEQSAIAGEVELARRRLVRLLVTEPPPEADVVRQAAREAGWPLPRTLAAVAIAPGDGSKAGLTFRLPVGGLAEAVDELLCAIIPDPDAPRRRAELERALRETGARAGLGTTVVWEHAARSFTRARAALALGSEQPLVSARERAGELLLAVDPELASELAADRLAPLATLSAGSRQRLQETLAAWLEEQGRLGAVAGRLSIHPQTARYRMGRLRELFGAALDDPEQRFWLQVALRVTRQ